MITFFPLYIKEINFQFYTLLYETYGVYQWYSLVNPMGLLVSAAVKLQLKRLGGLILQF
jgi:hypothetical protein